MSTGRRHGLVTGALMLLAVLVAGWVALPEGLRPAHSEVTHPVVLAVSVVLAAVIAVGRVARRGSGGQGSAVARGDLFLAAGIVAYACGWAYWALFLWRLESPPYPSAADALWLLLYPGALMTVYRDALALTHSHRAFVLELALGTAGVAAAVVGFALPTFAHSVDEGALVAVNVMYVGADAALLLLGFQVLALSRFRAPGRSWARAVAFLVLAFSDTAYMEIVVRTGRIPDDGPIAAGWLAATFLLVLSIGPRVDRSTARPPRWSVFVVPTAGTLLALAVLVAAPVDSPAAVAARWLAAPAIVLAAVRMGVAVDDAASLRGSHELAVSDDLTGLRNRRGFFAAAAQRRPGPTALVLLDLDRFKEVNDTFGHSSGDALLTVVARRLAEASREYPRAPPDVVARLGGDEFAVLLATGSQDEAFAAAVRMVDAVCSRYDVDGMSLRVAASAGVAFDDEGAIPVVELLRRADVAMYAAKGSGGGVVTFRAELDAASPEAFARQDAQREAFAAGGVELHYQPQVDLRTGRTVGVEALARLRTADGQLLLPGEFLPDLTRSGRLGELTTQVIDLALAQARRWVDAGSPLPVSVNVSAESVADLAVTVRHGLAAHRVAGSMLCIEVTEDALVDDRAMVAEVLSGLRTLGVRVSIDDYGTGYSTLSYLRELPLDELKIDRTFVRGLADDPRSRTIVASTAALAHGLGLVLVAEGVETAEDAAAARSLGCDVAQGFHFARPAPAADLADLLTERPVAGEDASLDRPRRPD